MTDMANRRTNRRANQGNEKDDIGQVRSTALLGAHHSGRRRIKGALATIVFAPFIIFVGLRSPPDIERWQNQSSSSNFPGGSHRGKGEPGGIERSTRARGPSRRDGVQHGASKRKLSHHATSVDTSCLDPNGPRPYILMTLGRSGSGSTWQIIGNLTGRETPSHELTGNGIPPSQKFFEEFADDDGQWMVDALCQKQRDDPSAKVVGFKWKPFNETMHTRPAQAALKIAAAGSTSPRIKVVRSRRKILDVVISKQKHFMVSKEREEEKASSPSKKGGEKRAREKRKLDAHCMKDDEACQQRHREAGTGLRLPTRGLVDVVRYLTRQEDKVDRLLELLGVPTIHVSYEKLYSRKDPEEWMRIFRFLGAGPGDGLEWKDVEGAMKHVSTSNGFHNETLRNYEEVRRELEGTEFAGLLH